MESDDSLGVEVSSILKRIHRGEDKAKDELFSKINERLRALAAGLMRNERVDHTLHASGLVNEACVRLLQQGVVDNAENRRYLFGAAVRAMRQVLVDHARKKAARKHGGEHERHPLDCVIDDFESTHLASFLDLEEALNRLEKESPRQREVVELRFFSGLTIAETSQLLDCSHGTVETEWRVARAKLYAWLTAE